MIKNTREERHESGGGVHFRLSDQRTLFEEMRISPDLRAERLDLGLAGVRALQAGGTASAKALRPKCASVGGVTASRGNVTREARVRARETQVIVRRQMT